jgi:hypothetical protein
MQLDVSPGDRLRVELETPTPFGGHQTAEFDVTDTDGDVIFGEDPAWGDETELLCGAGLPHYADAGKSGDALSVLCMDTDDRGNTIVGSGEVLFEA